MRHKKALGLTAAAFTVLAAARTENARRDRKKARRRLRRRAKINSVLYLVLHRQ
jgi:hypothetical protein